MFEAYAAEDRFGIRSYKMCAITDYIAHSAYMIHQDRKDVVSYCLACLKRLGEKSSVLRASSPIQSLITKNADRLVC
jgi:hypothetical protein